MNKKSINFNNKKFKKATSTIKNKKIIDIDDIDVNKILVPKKEQYGKNNSFKYFIGYNDNDIIKPLYLELPQMIGYINTFNENNNKNTITMSLKVENKKDFKNYNKIWKKN